MSTMKYQIFTPSGFRDANKSIPNDIDDFLNKNMEPSDTDITTIPFTDTICYKTTHRRYNLWFTKVIHNDITLYVLKEIEDRSNKSFFNVFSREEMVNKFSLSKAEESEIKKWYIKTFVKPETKAKLLPDMEKFEGIRDFSNSSTSFVYEMYDWTIHISGVEFNYASIFALLQRIIINKEKEDKDDDGWKSKKVNDSDLQIIYRINRSKATYYYLYDIVENDKLQDTINVLKNLTQKNINKILKNESNDIDEEIAKYWELFDDDNLKRRALKGYPDYVMYGKGEDWAKIERDDDANLALSEEEIDILQDTHYPCFFNGLAGSGKSTILYYLFVNAFLYQLLWKKDKNMLFLSYSDKLIESARNVATALGTTNYRRWTTDNAIDDDTIKEKIAECFSPFQIFLKKNYLSDELQNGKYNDNKFLDYKKFLVKYDEWRLGDKKKSPLVWAVIRYIKGHNFKHDYTPEEYETTVSKKNNQQLTVDIEDYRTIYNEIYPKYSNKLKEENLWDDLDMVRDILNKIEYVNNYPKYDVIFCDEAQDFTPIEIELILKTSKYFDYDLKYFKTIPIAFAGDPNQTISPTGFNWSRLKNVFNESFKEQIGGYIRLSDCTLNNNYRSKSNIIRLSNTIQYLRSLFTNENLQPQNEWNTSDNPIPGFVKIEDKRMGVIESALNNIECIITGDDGEIPTIDETLSKQDKSLICTSASSKGLEYNTVILYRFADNLPSDDSFSKVFEGKQLNSYETFACEYFITKLYVAITRAREILYIFDTAPNYERFWKKFVNNTFVNDTLKKDMYAEKWRTKVGGLVEPLESEFEVVKGESKIEKDIKDKSHRYIIAERIFNNAKFGKDLSLMERAKGYFSLCKGKDKEKSKKRVKVCEAYICLYKGEYEDSGDKFIHLNMLMEAENAYWVGQCWNKLQLQNHCVHRHRLEIAKYCLSDNNYTLKDLIKAFSNNNDEWIRQYSPTDDTWVFVIEKIRLDALENYKTDIDVFNFIVKLKKDCLLSSLSDTIAELYYWQGKYEKAIEIWENCGNITHTNFYQSQVEVAKSRNDHNAIIKWESRLGKTDLIERNYGKNIDISKYNLNSESQSIIFHILLQTNYCAASAYPWNDDDKYNSLYRADKNKFLEYCILDDYSQDKFILWVEDMVKDNDLEIFNDRIDQNIFTKIFSIGNDWMLFLGLRDNNNNRVFFRKQYNDAIIQSLTNNILPSKTIESSKLRQFALCLLDALFGKDYKHKTADNNEAYITDILQRIEFNRKDFYDTLPDNYFSKCNIGKEGVVLIRDHFTDFINRHLEKKLRAFEEYCRLFEQLSNDDNNDILNFYNNLSGVNKTDNERFINFRIAFYKAITKNNATILYASFTDNQTKKDFMSSLDREDARLLVELVAKDNSIIDNDALTISELIYKKSIYKENYKNAKTQTALEIFVNRNIEKLLKQNSKDEVLIKLLCYVGETVMESNVVTNLYNDLIKRNNISHNLNKYLKERVAKGVYGKDNRPKNISTTKTSTLTEEEKAILQNVDKLKKAKEMVNNFYDSDEIQEQTGLSPNVIKALKMLMRKNDFNEISKVSNLSIDLLKKL